MKGFENICVAIKKLATLHPEVMFIYPVHLNPNVREPVNAILKGSPNVKLIEPQGYPQFVYLMMNAKLILTDSGGIQEEAPSLAKPVLVIRESTERIESIEAKTSKLIGTNPDNIFKEVSELILNKTKHQKMAKAINPYGDGHSSERILSHCLEFLKIK